ncbi:MAG: pyridoxal phosphate-dependent aminotransferase [Desulfobulbus sp.]|nr:pyridoxal phosphate-dependent aminotransferase [Desulfobulbus sp.]
MNSPLPFLSQRVNNIAVSATKAMAEKAARIGGCVSLGQGVPSFATPDGVIARITEILKTDPACGKYTLQTGMPRLRERIAHMLLQEQGIRIDPQRELCLTVGAMEGLLATLMSLVDPGDEVILPTPTYASYIEQIHLTGGVPVYAPLAPDWSLDLEAITKAISPKTRALMLCNPGNPTGNVIKDAAVLALCDLAVQYRFVLVVDATYDYLVYGGKAPLNPLSLPQYQGHVVSVSSLSKKYALTGWRIGWVTAANPLMAGIMKVHDATTICAPTPSQFAALAALELEPDWLQDCRKKLERRRNLCCQRLDELKEFFSYVAPQGAFYVMARTLFSDRPSHEVADLLLQGARVITIPGESYGPGGEGHLRLSFGGEEAEINVAFDRIEAWLKTGKVGG